MESKKYYFATSEGFKGNLEVLSFQKSCRRLNLFTQFQTKTVKQNDKIIKFERGVIIYIN